MNDYDDIFCGSLALLGKNWVQLIPGGHRSVAPSYPLTGTVSLGGQIGDKEAGGVCPMNPAVFLHDKERQKLVLYFRRQTIMSQVSGGCQSHSLLSLRYPVPV